MYTEDEIRKMHVALYEGCSLPVLPLRINDQRQWHDFLEEMKPLADTPGGPFRLADLVAVLAVMLEQKRNGVGWAMRPSKILREPETIRDLVLEARSKLKIRARAAERNAAAKPAIQHLPDGTTRQLDTTEAPDADYETARDASLQQLAEFRRLRGGN